MSEKNLNRLLSALIRSGAEDVALKRGKHHKLLFSIGGRKAGPIIISCTPSDRSAGVKVAADIRREFKRLGVLPPPMAAIGAYASVTGTPGVFARIVGAIAARIGSHKGGESIWTLLDEFEKDS